MNIHTRLFVSKPTIIQHISFLSTIGVYGSSLRSYIPKILNLNIRRMMKINGFACVSEKCNPSSDKSSDSTTVKRLKHTTTQSQYTVARTLKNFLSFFPLLLSSTLFLSRYQLDGSLFVIAPINSQPLNLNA